MIRPRTNAMSVNTRPNMNLPSAPSLQFVKESSTDNDNETDTDNYDQILDKMRNSIAYVYIRGHSSLPYNRNNTVLPYNDDTLPFNYDTHPHERKIIPFDTYAIPTEMELLKITAASNGDSNYNYYEYQDKKDVIITSIRDFYLDILKEKKEKDDIDIFDAAEHISAFLKKREKDENIEGWKKRNETNWDQNKDMPGKIVLNKIISPLTEELIEREIKSYMPVQILFLDINYEELNRNEINNNAFISLDIYPFIHEKYRANGVSTFPEAIKMEDIIKYLHEDLKLTRVVLLDFTCSSYNEENKGNLMIRLNKNNLHGGRKKTRKTKKQKKTRKTKKQRKTKKTKKQKKRNYCKSSVS